MAGSWHPSDGLHRNLDPRRRLMQQRSEIITGAVPVAALRPVASFAEKYGG